MSRPEAEYRRSGVAGPLVSKGRAEVAGMTKRRGASRNQCHPPSHPSQDAPMSPNPSPTYERLRQTSAERMRMSPINQPLMLMELLGRSSPAPAQGITRNRNSSTSLISGEGVTAPEPPCTGAQNPRVAATSERRIKRVSGSMGERSKPMCR